MLSRISIISLFLLLIFVLVQCGDPHKPKHLISPKKYENLLIEFQLLKSYQNKYHDSTQTVELRKKILSHYDVSLEQFKKSDNYYKRNIKKESKRLKDALDRLNEQRDTIWSQGHKQPPHKPKLKRKIKAEKKRELKKRAKTKNKPIKKMIK